MLNVFERSKNFTMFFQMIFFLTLLIFLSQFGDIAFAKQVLKRDPFVPLLDKDGNIRRGQDLFISTEEIMPKIILKGILWNEKNPLAVINGKVLSEGSQIPLDEGEFAKVIILEKINPDSIVLNYNDREFIIKLRKEEKE